ncbi:hypothetical protein [Sphingobium arseniciresistens]|uniref:hypothetical protein n=1 Tax=Sphingobium arseniciresistens TaxID=3030834 RepID=UPI003BB13FA4
MEEAPERCLCRAARLTASQYQQAFDEHAANGFRLVSVSGYCDTGIGRYAATLHADNSGQQ